MSTSVLKPSEMVLDDGGRFKVHRQVYMDADVFDREMDRVFHSNWVYVAHTSEVPNPGDYRTVTIGRQPAIVSRDQDDRINVLINRCSHRGAVVCRAERGHSNHFRCFYHNWIFDNAGNLVGTAQRSGYPDDFDRSEMGLARAAKVGTYRGLIFASLSPDVPDFDERIAHVGRYIDLWADRSLDGQVRIAPEPERYTFPANWKFQAENGVDGYHGNYVHESFAKLLERSGERTLRDITKARNQVGARNYAKGLPFGDGLLERESGMLGSFDVSVQEEYQRRLVERHGEEAAHEISMMRNVYVFPNLYLFESHVRVLRPVAHDSTIADNHFFTLGGVDDALNLARVREHERFFGAGGMGATDDVEIFVYNQTGLQADALEWIDLSRGLHREVVNDDGEHQGHSSDEQPQRALYRRWLQLMS
jgi:benzoate/toluate 1,2-dioxygenase subunit alpha